MVNPTGYKALDMIGFTDQGTYSSSDNYVKNDLVHYSGNIWRCLIDDTTGIAPAEGVNWTLFIGEPTNLVERIIALVETDPATNAWAVGRQIIYNDNLYEVIATITAGDALVAYEDDPTNANIKLADPFETQLLNVKGNLSNRNLLDNAWFTINQRGDTSWSSYAGYKLDRWMMDGGNGSINDGVFTHSNTYFQIWEDSRVNTILGKTVTMSWMLSDGTIGSETTTLPSSLTSSYVWLLNNPYVNMALISGGTQIARAAGGTSLKAVKLELGTVSTLAMDTAPNYAEELLKCQRYFYKAMGNLSAGYTLDTNLGQARIGVPVPVRMRTTPTVSMSVAGSIIDSDGGTWAISNASLNSMAGNIIDVTVTTNRTTNTMLPCVNVDSQFDFSADL